MDRNIGGIPVWGTEVDSETLQPKSMGVPFLSGGAPPRALRF